MPNAALVTGGARRVGRHIALHLASHGYDIALHCNHSLEEAAQIKQEIEQLGQQVEIFPFDLKATEQIGPWFAEISNQFPHLNVLVNNASVFKRISFTSSDYADYAEHMAVNAAAPIFLTKAFAEKVKTGQVINLVDTDLASTHGSHFFYLLSKKTLAEFTKMAARDLGPHIRVNAICPGVVLPSDQNIEGYEARLETRLPLQTLSDVADITAALDYILHAPHVTGQFLYTDSGQHLL